MASGVYVWVGVKPSLPAWDEDHAAVSTVAPTRQACAQKIMEAGGLDDYEPAQRLLILKGRMC